MDYTGENCRRRLLNQANIKQRIDVPSPCHCCYNGCKRNRFTSSHTVASCNKCCSASPSCANPRSSTFLRMSSTDCTFRGSRECPCSISMSGGHKRFLDFVWNIEAEAQRKSTACRCCDTSQKFRRCSEDKGHCPCPCVAAGHDVHFLCNATDQNNLVARIAALRHQITYNTKWLLINIAVITILITLEEDVPAIISLTFLSICSLNVIYYILKNCKLHYAVRRKQLERPASSSQNCLWEKNLPKDLTRYFENAGDQFFCRYWEYFGNLVSNLRTVRSSPLGRLVTERGMEQELRTLGDSILREHTKERKRRSEFEDARYRMPLLKCKKPVMSLKQLEKYWKDYEKAGEDEMIRLSRAQVPFCPDLTSAVSRGSTNPLYLGDRCDDRSTNHVAVPSIIMKLVYQNSCTSDLHPNPAMASQSLGSFFDFMKIQHSKDYCSAFKWAANLKIWLSMKIREVVEQFDIANDLLRRHGLGNVKIGESSAFDLQGAFRIEDELSTFSPLLAFLTLTHKQSYLVWRYRVLASQPCLSSYVWDEGGDTRGNWTPETGPCDSEIVLHFFCSYMDMKLPDLPLHPSQKLPFSSAYLIQTIDQAQATYRELAIVRQWVSPPHFNILFRGGIIEMPGGSLNLFLTLAYLIYCFKIHQQGKIGRTSLGKDGLNLLWIVGDNES